MELFSPLPCCLLHSKIRTLERFARRSGGRPSADRDHSSRSARGVFASSLCLAHTLTNLVAGNRLPRVCRAALIQTCSPQGASVAPLLHANADNHLEIDPPRPFQFCARSCFVTHLPVDETQMHARMARNSIIATNSNCEFLETHTNVNINSILFRDRYQIASLGTFLRQ